MIIQIFTFLQVFIFALLALSTLNIFVFAISGLFYRQHAFPPAAMTKKIAVFIPAYREDRVIITSIQNALAQDFDKACFDIIVIADSLLPRTLELIKKLPVFVIEVAFESSTKAKALNVALTQIPGNYDIAVILDADNHMAPGFLNKVNEACSAGISVVQGHRLPKNMNSNLAILDGLSEEINNNIFRKGQRVWGLSSSLTGSGMAFSYELFKEMMPGIHAVGGFDKAIELYLLKKKICVDYIADAIVYDEKTGNPEAFVNQRRRWLAAQFYYFRRDFFSSLKELFGHGNLGYFQKVFQLIQPPRILLLGLVFFFSLIFITVNYLSVNIQIFNYLWISLLVCCLLAFLLSIPKKFYNFKTIKALVSLPKAMWLIFCSFVSIHGANKKFLHTTHTFISTGSK